MKFLCRYWTYISFIIALTAVVALVINWDNMSVLARVNCINFIVFGIHQFEEYTLPGGMRSIWLRMTQDSIS